jgi:hypothetical protein
MENIARKELIAAAGFNSLTNTPGDLSFTHALTEEFEKRADSDSIFSTGTLNRDISINLARKWHHAPQKEKPAAPTHIKLGKENLLPEIPLRTFKFDSPLENHPENINTDYEAGISDNADDFDSSDDSGVYMDWVWNE